MAKIPPTTPAAMQAATSTPITGPLVSRSGRGGIVCAHRGASATHPENTHAAFEAAAVCADYVETDVRHTADDAAILFHDKTLRRTTNAVDIFPERADDPVETFTLAEIRRLDAGSWFSPEYTGQQVPTLREGLDVLEHAGCGMYLEVKTPILELVADQLRNFLADHPGFPLVVGSVQVPLARGLSGVLPEVPSGVLFVDESTLDADTLTDYATFARFLGFRNDHLTAQTIAAVHLADLQVLHNTNTAQAMIECAARGVDGTVTDNPALKAALTGQTPVAVIEAQDLAADTAGPARALARTIGQLSYTLPFKPSGGAVLTIPAIRPGDWCELTLTTAEPGRVEFTAVTGPQVGAYEISWDGTPIQHLDGQSRSPARRTVHITTSADPGVHRLRFILLHNTSEHAAQPLALDTITLHPAGVHPNTVHPRTGKDPS